MKTKDVVLLGFRATRRVLAASALTFVLAICANAQWTVVNLHPAGTDNSIALGVGSGQQVGWAHVSGVRHASLWAGRAASWVDLHPAGATLSEAYGVQSGQQVGVAVVGNVYSASLWAGTAASWVDLNPAGSGQSFANGVHAGQQVGRALVDGAGHAGLWTGSAASWVDLNPAGLRGSDALGTHEGQQVGWADVGGGQHASLWRGTAASWEDLHPAGMLYSGAYGVAEGQQVGYADVNGSRLHASLWAGTAASWVDLHPAGATSSWAFGVQGARQVGWAEVAGYRHASLWTGTAGSWADLHSLLPAGFVLSEALGIWYSGRSTYVVGYGYNTTTLRYEALMWVENVAVPPSSFTVTRGFRVDGGLSELPMSDDRYMIIQQRPPFLASDPNIQLVVEGTAPEETAAYFKFKLEASSNAFPSARAPQRIELYDYQQGRWDIVDERPPTFSDSIVEVEFTQNAQRFIQPGTKTIKARMGWIDRGVVAANWFAAIDQTIWEIAP